MDKQLQTRICRENDKKAIYTKLANKLSRGVKSEGKEQYYDTTGKPFVKYTIK